MVLASVRCGFSSARGFPDTVVALWAVQKAGAAALFAHGLSFGEIVSAGAGFGITLEVTASPTKILTGPTLATPSTGPRHPFGRGIAAAETDHPW